MSDSESDISAPAKNPSEKTLTAGLRDAVATIFKTGKEEELTIKRVRLAAEKALGLEQGFFRNDETWKAMSDEIIRDEAEKQENARDNPPPKSSPVAPKRSQPPNKAAAAAKRASTDTQKSRKRQKTRSPSPSSGELSSPPEEESEESEEEVVQKKSRRATSAPKKSAKVEEPVVKDVSDTSELSDAPDEESAQESSMKPKEAEKKDNTGVENAEASESELSVLLDEEPKSKRKRSAGSAGQTKKPKKETASKAKESTNLDSDQAEIKRLQGWLIKCGIRKMWYRELAPFSTPKAKISHLKGMLKEAGMEGRYSVEKAKKIKEERELRADLEMVQEGAKRWGADGAADESEEEEKPRRRLARGLKNFDFLGDDAEETD